jgi:hypothetical protein
VPSLQEMFEQSRRHAVLDQFEHEPCSLTRFVQDRKFLANPPLSPLQYDAVRHAERIYYPDMYPMLAERSSDQETRDYWSEPALDGSRVRMVNFVTLEWGKGAGKDHICRIISLRIAYLLLCLRSPTDYFVLPEQDSIHLLNVASSSTQANRAFFQPLRRALMRDGNWFREHDYVRPLMNEIEYAKNVMAISGHSDAETQEGLNLLLGVADEIDAFKSQAELEAQFGARSREATTTAEGILKMIRSSARTRFAGTFKNVRISWPRYKGSMIQQLVAQGELSIADQGARSAHYISGPFATWDVNPRVPGKAAFEDDYREDPIGAAARYECRPQRAVNPYFANEGAIEAAQVPSLRQPLIISYKRGVRAWDPDFDFSTDLKPIKGALYAMHADMAKNGDRAGLAMAHVVRQEEVRAIITAEDGQEVETYMLVPHVKVDFVISFEADLGQAPPREIQIRWARQLFVVLRNRQFNVRSFTFDGYQSLDSMQILEVQYGVKADRLSTDMSEEPWRNLRDLITDDRVRWPARPVLFNELLGLSRMPNRRIDHLAGGSKDEADALACAVQGAVLLGGQEDPSGAQAYIEPDVQLPPAHLESMLPFGFSDPAVIRPDNLMHSAPISLDGMGRPVIYAPGAEEADVYGLEEGTPEEAYHRG